MYFAVAPSTVFQSKAVYHTTLRDQYLRPVELAQYHGSQMDRLTAAHKKLNKKLHGVKALPYTYESLRQDAFLRHVHEVIDRRLVYSMCLTDIDRTQGLDTLSHALQNPAWEGHAGGELDCDAMEADGMEIEPGVGLKSSIKCFEVSLHFG